MAKIMSLLKKGKKNAALEQAFAWQVEKPGDVMALVALAYALRAQKRYLLAARVIGSIIDFYPSRADMRRFAGEFLDSLGGVAQDLAADTYAEAAKQRPDHPASHRLLAYALIRVGQPAKAFVALENGLKRRYPSGRFRGAVRILQEDLGIVGAAWLKQHPNSKGEILNRLKKFNARLAKRRSLRFILTWETDANDVDFHIHDGKKGHAYYSSKKLPSGGELYEDITNGYGPECFTIYGKPKAFPYRLRAHYYSRGPMGFGMGKVETVQHDGRGGLKFKQHPFVVMNDGAYVELGNLRKPL
jgi:tetratricopeptide (TPR) repeat protein